MRDKLVGWDLLTWRLGFEDTGIVPLVGSQITVAGHVDFSTLLTLVQTTVDDHVVLRLGLTKDEFPTLRHLEEFDIGDCIHVLHHHVNPAQVALRTAAQEFSMTRFNENLPLWRIFVVHNENETLLFAFLHHAIADGRTALELVLRLCGEPAMQEASSTQSVGNPFSEIVGEVLSNPLSLIEKIPPTLLNFNSLAALSPRHTLPHFSSRSFRDDVVQFSLLRDVMRKKANDLSVSVHDLSVAMTMRFIQTLERHMHLPLSNPIRINVPVASKQSDTLNQIFIARLFIEGEDFESSALNYRWQFHDWKDQPALRLYATALEALSKVPRIDLTGFASTSDATVSSLPRITKDLTLAGQKVLSLWPLVPSMGSAVNCTSIGLNDVQYYTLTYDVGTKIDGVLLRKVIREVVEKDIGTVPNFQQSA